MFRVLFLAATAAALAGCAGSEPATQATFRATMPSARATAPSPAQTTTCDAGWLSIFRRPMPSELRSRCPEGDRFAA
jgi:hypothetical protein